MRSSTSGWRAIATGLTTVFLLSSLPSSPDASVSFDPIKLRMERPAEPARAGEVFEGRIDVHTVRSVEIYDFALEGEGWTVHRVEAPASTITMDGGTLELRFAATPSDPDRPLWLTFTADGNAVRQRIDLSEGAVGARPLPLVERPEIAEVPGDGSDSPEPPPAIDVDDVIVAARGSAAARTITVRGRFVYTRSDGQQIGAYGLTAKVYDDNGIFAARFLGSDVTNSSGDFEVTFSWDDFFDPDPDLYVRFFTESGRVLVKSGDLFAGPYSWATTVRNNYSGTNLNIGTVIPTAESQMPRLHILTNGTRAWAYVQAYAGLDVPKVTFLYPYDRWPAYSQFFQEIYVPEDYDTDPSDPDNATTPFQWRTDTHIHEWGHHFINNFAQPTIPDYCNNICDQNTQGWLWEIDCGHCAWCEETASDAWAEGWPNWLADLVTRNYATLWGTAALFTRSQENLRNCRDSNGDPCPCNPWKTEGFLGALLRDIEDATQDDHDGDGLSDALSLGIDEIFAVTDVFNVTTPIGFLDHFRIRYPQHTEALWETARNVGYEIDSSVPGTVSDFTSTSHATTGDSPDRTVDLTWTAATDDASGIAGYSIRVGTSAALPDATPETGRVTSYTTEPLAPGTWWFSIRAIDRSGKAANNYRSYGPVTIRAADPANLSWYPRTGWTHPVLPRATNDATASSAPASASLDRDQTWINVSAQNDGESSLSGQTTRVYVDDVYRYYLAWGTIGAGVTFHAANYGPIPIRGGRHTFWSWLDGNEEVAETDEIDNQFGKQWVWHPEPLQPGTPLTRSRPGDADAGWSTLPPDDRRWFNADGYRINSTGGFGATVLRSTNPTVDYDLRLHGTSTGSTNGFTTNIGYGTRPAGALDVVLTNSNRTGTRGYDVGVVNRYGGRSNYVIETLDALDVDYGDSTTVNVASGQYFLLREFVVDTPNTGAVSVTLEVDPATGPWNLAWFTKDFVYGDLLDADQIVTTDAEGKARVDVTVATASPVETYAFAIYRDPRDGSVATAVTYEISRTPPDMLAHQATGWHSPFVPRAANDGTSGSVPVPTTLPGNVASTYFNVATRNASPTGTGSVTAYMYQDGVARWYLGWGSFGANATNLFNWGSAWTVPGGRHTLAVRHDVHEQYEEISEENNVYGEQYVWSPLQLQIDVPVGRGTPPARIGGWDDIRSGEARWYNCDGLRSPAFAPSGQDGYWGFVALVPRGSSDVDMRLHPTSTGAKNGFASNLGYSGWGPGESELLLVNFDETPIRAFDVGVLNLSGSGGYDVHAGSSRRLSPDGGAYGPFTLASGHVAAVYEIELPVGVHILHLDNRSDAADLGFGLHGPGASIRTKSDVLVGGAGWRNGPGEDEWITVEVTQPGSHAIAVWRVGNTGLTSPVPYSLRLESGATDVPADPGRVRQTAFTSIVPNPFNPRTTIEFAVAQEGRTEIAVFNLRGERVRTLVASELAAGSHRVVWNGLDDNGRPVASGVYTALLRSGAVEDRRKLVLVK